MGTPEYKTPNLRADYVEHDGEFLFSLVIKTGNRGECDGFDNLRISPEDLQGIVTYLQSKLDKYNKK